MFSLKNHARRNARIIAVGAAATFAWTATTAIAVTFDWDPAKNADNSIAPPASGGNGDFNNTDPNFANDTYTADVAAPGDPGTTSGPRATSTSDVHFGNGGGAVNLNADTAVQSLTFDSGGYTISTANASTLFLASQDNGNVNLNNLAGDNTISANIFSVNGGAATTQDINVAGGTSLTLGNFTNGAYYSLPTPSGGSYGSIRKTGAGALLFTGTLSNARAFQKLIVENGTVGLQGTSNVIGQDLVVQTNGVISNSVTSTSKVRLNSGTAQFQIDGHVAPGVNTSGNFGGVGTFSTLSGAGSPNTNGITTTFGATSSLDLDLASLASYDVLQLTAGNYGSQFLNIVNGAVVNINNGTGSLEEGTYHFLVMDQTPGKPDTLRTITGNFIEGNVPDNYTYQFVPQGSGTAFTGIDLIVTAAAIPEPASLAMIGIGAGLLLTRRRRSAKA